jgi:hypothetical protein
LKGEDLSTAVIVKARQFAESHSNMADDRASGDDQETQEQKPDLKPEATHINLKVKAQARWQAEEATQ